MGTDPNFQVFREILLSFTTHSLVTRTENYVGLMNYSHLLTDSDYIRTVNNTVIFTVASISVKFVVGLQLPVFGDIYPWGQLMAASLLMAIPVVIIYILAQRYLVEGLTAGSIKG